jgi:hypothetical protein
VTDRPDLDRILEGYALGELEPHTRRVAEDVLAGRHEDMSADEAREILRFERALAEGLDAESGEDSGDQVADLVLDRLYRRPEYGSRRNFRRDLAAEVVTGAARAGRVTATEPRRRYYFERPGFLRAAGFLVVLGGFMFMGLRDYWEAKQRPESVPVVTSIAPQPIANLAFVANSEASPESVETPAAMDAVYAGATIETKQNQRALVTLPRGAGRLVVYPQSRLRLLRHIGTSQVRIFIEAGGLWADLPGHQPLLVQAGRHYGGQLRGRGEVVLAARTLGTERDVLSPAFGRALLVSVEGEGHAVFRNGSEEISIRGDEVGVLGETAVMKMPRGSRAAVQVPRRDWPLGNAIEDPNGEAIRIGGQIFTREAVIREAMRVYGPDLVDMQVRSLVIQRELRRRAIKVSPALRELARAHVWQDEMMQVAPLRSLAALEERVFQVSGLLSLAYGSPDAKGRESALSGVTSQLCESLWGRLATRVRIEWPTRKDESFALRVRFDDEVISEFDLAQAWGLLRDYLRPSEVEGLMDDMIERWVIQTWLRANGGDWPEATWQEEADPRRRAAQELLVRMSGITPVQFLGRTATRRVVLAYEPVPSAAAVEEFLNEELPDVERVAFEHFVFPFALGGEDGSEDPVRARRLAEAAVATLRSGTGSYPPSLEGAHEYPSLWRTGPRYGPRPWWDEIYGAEFRKTVMGLRKGEVSGVIAGPEAFHVVRMKRQVKAEESLVARRKRARELLMMETARSRVGELLDRVAMERIDGRSLLR